MGLTENIVYVRPLGDVPKRALGCCQWKEEKKKTHNPTKKRFLESLGQPLAEQIRHVRV